MRHDLTKEEGVLEWATYFDRTTGEHTRVDRAIASKLASAKRFMEFVTKKAKENGPLRTTAVTIVHAFAAEEARRSAKE